MKNFIKIIGITPQASRSREVFISFFGGLISIYAIYLVTSQLFGVEEAVYIIPSMGATAVLLFAAPNAPFSQPWNVFAGHLISAAIGVACFQFIPDIHIAAASSVGIAIGVMVIFRCIHPPGGATALAAVIGSAQLQELSYLYVITPVLINVVTILVVAVGFNALFSWRQYPANLYKEADKSDGVKNPHSPIQHEDFVYALSQIDTVVDISEDDLLKIYALATSKK